MKTSRPMTKSPLAVARAALDAAREALPAYSTKFLPARLHPAPALRPADAPRVPQGRLPRPGADPPRVGRVARYLAADEDPRSFDDAEGRRAAAHKRGVD